jgi:diaminopimelate epimerase
VADGLQIAKGHGTENDFVLVADPNGAQDLGPALVRALCDRRAGIGGDGLIRVVRCDALPDGVDQAGEADWFMDYRNADGSLAQMCGNGIRVFAAYLLDQGLVAPGPDGGFTVGSRSGPVRVRPDGDLLAATLGAWSVPRRPAGTCRSASPATSATRRPPACCPACRYGPATRTWWSRSATRRCWPGWT